MRARVLLCIPFVVLMAVDAFAQSRVEGVVRATDGTPLAAVEVSLQGPEYKKPLTTATDAEGRYVFEKVKAGTRVRIIASRGGRRIADGHTLVTQWVETLDLAERPASMTPTTADDVMVSEGPSAEIRGVVRSADGRLVERALVRVGETPLASTTDAAGRYVFRRLRPGMLLPLNVTATGYEPAVRSVMVPDGGQAEVDFTLARAGRQPAEGDDSAEAEAETAAAPLSTEGWLMRAGIPSVVPSDVFRRVQFLPAVAGSLESSELLSVRGGLPGDAAVVYDGFTLYPTDHLFGAFSGFNADAVGETRLSPDGAGAADGGQLSGTLRLTGYSDIAGRPTGWGEFGLLSAGGFLGVPLARRGTVMFAGRISPPGTMFEDALDRFSIDEAVWARDRAPRFSGGALLPAPDTSFRDVNARLDLRPTDRDRVVVSAYDSRDGVNAARDLAVAASADSVTIPDGTFRPASDAVVQVSDTTEWDAYGMSGTWERQWSPSTSTTVSFGRSDVELAAQRAYLLADVASGADLSFVAGRGGSHALVQRNRLTDTTLRGAAALSVGFEHALLVGGEVKWIDLEYAMRGETFVPPPVGATPSTSQLAPIFGQIASGRTLTAFVQDAWRPASRLTVTPGLRLTSHDLAGETYVDPRVSAAYQLTPEFRLEGHWSLDHQVASRIVREDRVHGDGGFWAIADGQLVPVSRANKASGGITYEVPGVVFAVEGWYRSLDDLAVFAPRLFPGRAPAAGTTLFHRGTGTGYGIETSVRARNRYNTLVVSYAGGRVEHTFPTLAAAAFRASQDRAHELEVADTVRFGGRWSIGAAWVFATGRPYTPAQSVETVWFPDGVAVYNVVFGEKNSASLPEYHRLDLSGQGEFRIGRVRSTLGAAIFNVYDRQNTSYYDHEVVGEGFRVYDVRMMGRAYNVFVKVGL